ncbi:hypothetical protein pm098_03270 [Escherichia coli]|nr:hypothetical protein pm098_03270 [Escherichia coli]
MNITKSAPLPERLCERIAYCAILLTVYEADYSVVVAQSEGADHRYYSTPEMQNILLQNAVGHAVRKAKNFAGGATDAILSGRQVLINLMSDFVLDKTKATVESRQWKSYILERITNNATFAAGGQCDQSDLVRSKVCNESFFLCSLRNFSRAKAHGANLSDSCSIFLRRLFRAGDNVLVNSLSVIVLSCIAMRRSYSHHGAGDGYSCSLALRRWRRLISPRMAALINCPVLSPSSFTFSMPSIISWAIRAVTDCDFAFFGPVAMSNSLCFWCKTIYTKKNYFEGLTCKTLLLYIVSYTLFMQGAETTKPRTVGAVTGLLTTNDSESIEVAMLNHTTHPKGRDSHNLNKYIWRFIALSTAKPRVITIEATSEQEARQQSPAGYVMVFAARIRQGVCHVQ